MFCWLSCLSVMGGVWNGILWGNSKLSIIKDTACHTISQRKILLPISLLAMGLNVAPINCPLAMGLPRNNFPPYLVDALPVVITFIAFIDTATCEIVTGVKEAKNTQQQIFMNHLLLVFSLYNGTGRRNRDFYVLYLIHLCHLAN